MCAWTSPRTWVAGETVTAALLNSHLKDQLLHIAGTAGFTGSMSATVGVQPDAGYFLGGLTQNAHAEYGGASLTTAASASVNFSVPFASVPAVSVMSFATYLDYVLTVCTSSGFTVTAAGGSTTCAFRWVAVGP